MVTPELLGSVGYLSFPTTFIALKSTGIDVILGMNWLVKYEAILDCAAKSFTLTHPSSEIVRYWSPLAVPPSACSPFPPELEPYAMKGHTPPEIHELYVVCDFPDVFPEELRG